MMAATKNRKNRNLPQNQQRREENIKVCGLCSRLVDESVQINRSLRAFLIDFLNTENEELPNKVCSECYAGATNCKKFKENADRAAGKLKAKKLSENMILGRSAEDKREIRSMAPQMPVPRSHLVLSTDVKKYGISDAISVNVSGVEKSLAESALQSNSGSLSYGRKRKGMATPQPAKKRKSATSGRSCVPEKGYYNENNDDIIVVDPPASRTPKGQGKYYIDPPGNDDIEEVPAEEENDEIFPSVGPYQCEICKKISQTKVKFVQHIKSEHINVVDKDILRSLQEDLKKAKKKQTLKKQAPPGPVGRPVTVRPPPQGPRSANLPEKKKGKVGRKKGKTAYSAKAKAAAEIEKKKMEKKKALAAKKRAARAAKRNMSFDEDAPLISQSNKDLDSTNNTMDTLLESEVTIEGDEDKSYNWKANVAKKYEQENEAREEAFKQLEVQQLSDVSEDPLKESSNAGVNPADAQNESSQGQAEATDPISSSLEANKNDLVGQDLEADKNDFIDTGGEADKNDLISQDLEADKIDSINLGVEAEKNDSINPDLNRENNSAITDIEVSNAMETSEVDKNKEIPNDIIRDPEPSNVIETTDVSEKGDISNVLEPADTEQVSPSVETSESIENVEANKESEVVQESQGQDQWEQVQDANIIDTTVKDNNCAAIDNSEGAENGDGTDNPKSFQFF